MSAVQTAADAGLGFLASLGRAWLLAWESMQHFVGGLLRREKVRWRESVAQAFEAGNRSLPLVGLLTALIGMILALQSAEQLKRFGATDLVADLVSISVTRELAPLITAILVAGRVGSAMAAELGTMKVSEEIDALKVMGIDPVSFLVLPRLIGLGIALPCLTMLGDLLGILGGLVVAVSVLEVPAGGYLRDCLDALAMEDVWGGLLKAALFAVVIGLICCERGMSTSGGAAQVGRSTTSAVVRSIVFIIVVDLVVTALLYVN